MNDSDILTYDQLINKLALDCDGFSGASIAGVVRAAASRALARAVGQRSDDLDPSSKDEETPFTIMDCVVTQDDFYLAIHDARENAGFFDHTEEEDLTEEDLTDETDRRGFRTRLRHRIRSWMLAK